ncbi:MULTISPECIES: DUF6510 family protein [Sphingosinicellaceae]|uniref:DUF6510 family protein n=1 Tax=Sphingosinicellaceae TaxID=2820280 RepID=UPI001C725A70|nr:DUF6510 family protein [Polymorphobacter megasporae]
MTDVVHPLDGNAAAGPLSRLFASDVTGAVVVCGECGREGALATLALYGRGTGLVLRCPTCETVNLRLLDTGRTIHLDLRGCLRMSVRVALD